LFLQGNSGNYFQFIQGNNYTLMSFIQGNHHIWKITIIQ